MILHAKKNAWDLMTGRPLSDRIELENAYASAREFC